MKFLFDEYSYRTHCKSPEGAGLLAKARCQSLHMLTDTPLSRASPLPQGYIAVLKTVTNPP
ncbi:hypothetical protein DYL59_15510 [Pseudomonas kairouanensis]|uniref:Uncharacterized protein n=1 Tax=Pseudomonas kairouanensis TaxID=2293832 RepID=A0A4Z0AQ09_9PSED|nr:hypothetical protein DYL59_15510 [Pseudomonas kairouanensis]